MTPVDGDITQTSRSRLLASGKSLFSRLGYEQTSTAAIAREAGTSESQLVRYFSGKSGLLEAIFNEAWAGLNDAIRTNVDESEHGREAILRVLSLIVEAFGRATRLEHDAIRLDNGSFHTGPQMDLSITPLDIRNGMAVQIRKRNRGHAHPSGFGRLQTLRERLERPEEAG